MDKHEANLSEQECEALAGAMNRKYRIALDGRSFSVSCSAKAKMASVSVCLKNSDESFFYPVEARIMYEEQEMGLKEASFFLVDYIDQYFEEYLLEEDEQIFLPIDWTAHSYEAVDFHLKGQILNKKLEASADEWLAKHDGSARIDN